MSNIPYISVIVPVYNVERYLRDCLISLLDGQGDEYEVIAINDCSPDNSASILHEFERTYSNFKVIEFTQNQGVSVARNAGIDMARGDWLMFCDSDDVLVPGTLPLLKKKIASFDCELISFELKRVDTAREIVVQASDIREALHDMNDKDDATAFLCKIFPHKLWAWNKCFKRSLVGTLRFQDFQPCEDAIFTLECMTRADKILEMPNVLYKYVQHDGSCLKTISRSRLQGDIAGMAGLCDVVLSWKFGQSIKPYISRRLKEVFLRGIPHNICMLQSSFPSQAVGLADSFFKAADHVFVRAKLATMAERLAYKIVFATHSLKTLQMYFSLTDAIIKGLHAPRWVYRKLMRG